MESLIIQLKRKKKEAVRYISIMAGAYLFGLIMAILVCTLAGEQTSVTFGTIFVLAMAFFMHFFGNIFTFLQEFNLAVSMGQLRRKFVWCYEAAALLELIAMVALAGLMHFLEETVYRLFLPWVTLEIDVGAIFKPEILVPVILAMVIVEMFASALIMRFGPKSMWVVWAVWMLICLTPSQLVKNEELHTNVQRMLGAVANQVNQWGPAFMIPSAVVFGVVILAISWNMLRKQRVTV